MEKVLWIEVTEAITRKVGIWVDEDFTEEKANYLIEIGKKNKKLNPDSEEYILLDGYLNNEITHTEGYDNIKIFTEEDEEGKYQFCVGDTFYSKYLNFVEPNHSSIPIKVISVKSERDILNVEFSHNSRIEKWNLSCAISALINGDYSFSPFN